MKKQIKTTAAIALALSAVTPVAAFAAEANVPAGLYTSSSFTSLTTFATKTVKEKIAALSEPTAVLVLSNGKTVKASLILTASNEELNAATYATPAAYSAANNNVEFTDSGVKAPTATSELKVESVSAINGKEIQIKFNQKLDKASAETTGTYTLEETANGAAVAISAAKLGADGQTVTLTTTLANDKGYRLAVTTALKDANEKALSAAYSAVFAFSDKTGPKVTEVKSVNGNIEISFDEKIGTAVPNVIIDGKAATATAPSGTDNKAVVAKSALSALNLQSGKSYSIVVAGAQDYMTNDQTLYNGTFVYQAVTDTTAPTVTSVVPVNENTYTVTFSEKLNVAAVKLDGATDTTSDIGLAFTKAGVAIASGVTSYTKDGKVFTVSLDGTTANQIFDATKNETSVDLVLTVDGFKDEALNVGTKYQQTLKLTKDVVGPKLVSTTYNATTKQVVLTFDEGLDTKAAAAITPVVIDNKTGLAVTGGLTQVAVTKGDKQVKFDSTLAAGEYTVTLPAGSVTDTALNTKNSNLSVSGKVTVTADAAAGKPAVDTVAGAVVSGTNEITVKYTAGYFVKGGNVDGSATAAANYKLNGKDLPDGSTLVLTNTGTAGSGTEYSEVKITLPADASEYTMTGVLTTSGVHKANGTTALDAITKTVNLVDTKVPTITGAKVNADGKLVITFSESVYGTNAGTKIGSEVQPVTGDFIIAVEGSVVATGLTLENGTNNNEVIISSTDVSFATGVITVKAVTGGTTGKDAGGNSISPANIVTATR